MPLAVCTTLPAPESAEAVQSMTKKMLAMTCPDTSDAGAMAAYMNTMARYAAVKEGGTEVQGRTSRFVDGLLQAATP